MGDVAVRVVGTVRLDMNSGGHRHRQGVMELVFDLMRGLMAGGEADAWVDLDACGEVEPVPLEAESQLGHVAHPFDITDHRFGAGDQSDRRSRPRSSWALMATITVEALISTAAAAGARTIPAQASAPAARGMATTL